MAGSTTVFARETILRASLISLCSPTTMTWRTRLARACSGTCACTNTTRPRTRNSVTVGNSSPVRKWHLTDADAATLSFVTPDIDQDAELVFQVTVTDGFSVSTDTVTVRVEDAPQQQWSIDAGPDMQVVEGG